MQEAGPERQDPRHVDGLIKVIGRVETEITGQGIEVLFQPSLGPITHASNKSHASLLQTLPPYKLDNRRGQGREGDRTWLLPAHRSSVVVSNATAEACLGGTFWLFGAAGVADRFGKATREIWGVQLDMLAMAWSGQRRNYEWKMDARMAEVGNVRWYRSVFRILIHATLELPG